MKKATEETPIGGSGPKVSPPPSKRPMSFYLVIAAAVIALLWLIGSIAFGCQPDPAYTPTPTFKWDGVADEDLAGYKLYYRQAGGTYQLACDLPGEDWQQEQADGTFLTRTTWRGVDIDAALQRCLDGYELEELEVAVKAFDSSGNLSQDFSTCSPTGTCVVCMPEIWAPGRVYR